MFVSIGIYMKTPQRIKKDNEFRDPRLSLIEVQEIFKMMGNHYRLKILIELGKQKNLTLDQINQSVGGDFANISAHTKKMQKAGLIKKKYQDVHVLHTLTLNGRRALQALDKFNYSIE